ncbi:hypothetical protein F8A87_06695 [Betaproteobacteria bacterium SCN2]|jgi:hypothetical protein|nr:hypothetical protein F8A87_06695 [Betaproteobacteria bacterium SCN2]
MNQYLIDTEFAVQNLFELATSEELQLQALTENLRLKEAEFRVHHWGFQTSDLNDDFSDAYVMVAFGRAAMASQEAERLRGEVATLQASIGTHQHAVQAIAGAILQIAKQGISLFYGSREAAPTGRMLGSLPVRDVIWQARNQSMHYEEGAFGKPVCDLFTKLEQEQGPQFSLVNHPVQNRAKQIIDVLGWSDYGNYMQDMQVLLP